MTCRIILVATSMCFLAGNRPETTPVKQRTAKLVAAGEAGDISGYYVCKGKEADGKAYSGVTVISRKKDLYLVQWMVGAGSSFSGVGIRQGDTLAASWTMTADRGGVIRGVNLYRIEPGPRLVGHWATVPGPGVLQIETLTFLKRLDAED
jgi:hypothetical protein